MDVTYAYVFQVRTKDNGCGVCDTGTVSATARPSARPRTTGLTRPWGPLWRHCEVTRVSRGPRPPPTPPRGGTAAWTTPGVGSSSRPGPTSLPSAGGPSLRRAVTSRRVSYRWVTWLRFTFFTEIYWIRGVERNNGRIQGRSAAERLTKPLTWMNTLKLSDNSAAEALA